MSPHWQRGWDAPSANAQQKTKPQTHVCAISGGNGFGYFCRNKSNSSVRTRPDFDQPSTPSIHLK